MRQFVLIGGGHASASVARALRRKGFDGSIVIVGDEPHPPYQRPPLSKDFLAGEASLDDIWSVDPDWYGANGVTLKLGVSASRIDAEIGKVTLDDGTVLDADAVLIATGVSPRRIADCTSTRVHYLKTLADAEVIRAALNADAKLIVVGGGFVGLEIAAAARRLGAAVTVLEAGPVPLARALGPKIGAIIADLHRQEGVKILCDANVLAIEDRGDGVVVRMGGGGREIEGTLVVVGIGTTPNDQIARASEITVGNGIRVDEFGRTSAPNVFAAGDVANVHHMGFGRRMRVEHFDNATRQAQAIAANMLGERVELSDIPWFWSDQYDLNLQFAGIAGDHDSIVFRGSVEDHDFSAFYLKDGIVTGVFGLDRGGDVMQSKTLIEQKRVVDPAILADDDADLADYIMGAPEPDEPDLSETDDAAQEDDGYVRVARSGQVTEGLARRFAVDGLEIAIARSAGRVYALHNLCTHLACHLASGKVEGRGLTCLCHGSIFDLETGVPINPPATRPVRIFPVKEKDGQIYVKVS